MPIAVTLAGCGAVAENLYRRPLQRLERSGALSVTGLVDNSLERAKNMQRFFPKASIYENARDAFSGSKAGLAIVASPAAFHAEHSILALRNGNHVLCEKPMAVAMEQCTQMVQTALDTRRLLAMSMPRRFYPSFVHLKRMISRGELGENLSFAYREGEQYSWPVRTSTGFQRDKGGGGVFFDIGSHVLDLLTWLFGMPSNVSYFDDAMVGGVEANCLVRMKGPGFEGFAHLSWDCELANEFHVTGTEREVTISLDDVSCLVIKRSDVCERIQAQVAFPQTIENTRVKLGRPRVFSECFFFQIVQMIRAIDLGEHAIVSGEEGEKVISLLEQCYKIARPIDMLWLPPVQNEAYRHLHWNSR